MAYLYDLVVGEEIAQGAEMERWVIFTALLFIFLSFIIVTYSLLAGFLVAFNLFKSKTHPAKQKKLKWLIAIIFVGCIFLFAVKFLMYLANYETQPLPSDQEMIDHFYANRDAFEALVTSAREYDEHWKKSPHVEKLRQESGVDVIIGGRGYPHDDPCARDQEPELNTNLGPDTRLTIYDIKRAKNYANKYHRDALVIKMQDKERYYKKYYFNGNLNWKDYIYFRNGRSTKENKIKWQFTSNFKEIGRPQYAVYKSLDNLTTGSLYHAIWRTYLLATNPQALRALPSSKPQIWRGSQCVVREITPFWFLRRCRRD